MASGRPTTSGDGEGFPIPHSEDHRAPSVVSSRLSDDGGDVSRRKSVASKSGPSRPGTAKSAGSARSGSGDASKKKRISAIPGKRDTWAKQNEGSSSRTRTLTRGSHVPSLTSKAFFRPMSSQKLQAHRGAASRPTTMSQQVEQPPLDDDATDIGGSVMPRQSTSSNPPLGFQSRSHGDPMQLPPSRGTDNTDQDRITADTSPTNAQYPTGSLSDSVQPLHKGSDENRPKMNINVDKSYQNMDRNGSPIKSPRSFRSSFLLSGRSDSGRQNRNAERGEKLSSGASSPKFTKIPSHGQKEGVTAQPNQESKNERVYQYFEGNTNFYLGGRWQNTMGKPINVATGFCILLPAGLFYGFEAAWLWHNISPALPLIFTYITLVCFSSFLHASISDPGILPRNLHQFPPLDENEDPLRLGPRTNDWTLIRSSESKTAAMEVPVKHCRTCNIWRPPRGHHCRLCDNCIEGHDHHCVWINNCVGKRNYRFFFTFIASGTLLGFYAMATSLVQILVYQSRENTSFGAAIDHFRGAFALLLLSFIALAYPAALMGYHVFLMARGETTREYMNSHKFTKKERFRAYSQGNMFKNIWVVLCRPRPPTYYRFKNKYQPGDQRLGIRRDLRPKEDAQGLEMHNVAPGPGFQGPVALRGQSNG